MERVTTIRGNTPILFVAPHGYDDKNTDIMAEAAAVQCGGFAVINRGWERSDRVDELNSFANCNNIDHLAEDVVYEEFLEPLERFTENIIQNHGSMQYYIVHGCGNDARNVVGDPSMSGIIGYGDGNKPSLTCEDDMRFCFHASAKIWNWHMYHAGPGSKFSGRSKTNLNQFWKTSGYYPYVQGFQIEFVAAVRKTEADAEISGKCLGNLAEIVSQPNRQSIKISNIPVYP